MQPYQRWRRRRRHRLPALPRRPPTPQVPGDPDGRAVTHDGQPAAILEERHGPRRLRHDEAGG